jgi:hypothetical protein
METSKKDIVKQDVHGHQCHGLYKDPNLRQKQIFTKASNEKS